MDMRTVYCIMCQLIGFVEVKYNEFIGALVDFREWAVVVQTYVSLEPHHVDWRGHVWWRCVVAYALIMVRSLLDFRNVDGIPLGQQLFVCMIDSPSEIICVKWKVNWLIVKVRMLELKFYTRDLTTISNTACFVGFPTKDEIQIRERTQMMSLFTRVETKYNMIG